MKTNYKEQYQKQVKEGKTVKQNIELFKFTEDTPIIVGKYIGNEERMSDKFKTKYYSHTFLTDHGPIAIAPGVIVDKVLLQEGNIGKHFAVRFLGKKEGEAGNKFNDYYVESFDYASE